MFIHPIKDATWRGVRPDSVVASILAPYFSSSSTTWSKQFINTSAIVQQTGANQIKNKSYIALEKKVVPDIR